MSLNNRRVISIDDTSADIQYVEGSWFADASRSQDSVGNFGPVFNGTLHGVKTGRASLVYLFTGNVLQVFGTNNVQNNSGMLNPSWDCFIDGQKITSNPFGFSENNWSLCSSPKLQDGSHVLTVNVSVSNPQIFWLDQILYEPSDESQFSDALVRIDARNNMIQPAFGKGWLVAGTSNIMWTQAKGSKFTFQFTGVSLAWYGIQPADSPSSPATASYSINGGAETEFTINGPNSNSSTIYNVKFFETPRLPAGSHQIVVSFNGGSQAVPLTLDYLLIQNASLPGSSVSPAPTRTSVVSKTLTSSLHSEQSTPPIPGSSSQSAAPLGSVSAISAPGPSTHTGKWMTPVIVFASSICAIIVAIGLFLWARRIKKSNTLTQGTQIHNQDMSPTPFQYVSEIDHRFSMGGRKVKDITLNI